jgi:hypothetical protein
MVSCTDVEREVLPLGERGRVRSVSPLAFGPERLLGGRRVGPFLLDGRLLLRCLEDRHGPSPLGSCHLPVRRLGRYRSEVFRCGACAVVVLAHVTHSRATRLTSTLGRVLLRTAVVQVAVVLVLAACSSDAEPEPIGASVTAAPEVAVTSEVTEPDAAPTPRPTEAPTTTEQQAATTIPAGLPPQLDLTPADTITLGSGSSITSTSSIRGVPLAEVEAWVLAELARLGWVAAPPTDAPPGGRTIPFGGPGATGQVVLTLDAPDIVDLEIDLGPRPG